MSCCREGGYCDRCDLLVDLPGLRVVVVERDARDRLVVTVESPPGPDGVPLCGVARSATGGTHGGSWWTRRRSVGRSGSCGASGADLCPDPGCPTGSFVEQDEQGRRAAGRG